MSVDDALAKGIELQQQGRHREAIGVYQAILKIDQTHAGALHFLGVLLFQLSHNNDAIELVELALKYQPQYTEARNNLGNMHQALKNYDKAETAYSLVIEQQPDNADALNNLAAALKAQGKFEVALAHYHKAVELAPENGTFHYNLGNAYVSTNQLALALKAYTKATDLRPDDAIAYWKIGDIQRTLGDEQASLAALAKAAEIDQLQAKAHWQHGNALQKSGLLEDAVLAYLRALEFDRSLTQTYHPLIVTLNALGRLNESREHVREWLQLEPDSVTANHFHAAVTGEGVPARATDAYVASLFDSFSEFFDQNLNSLDYKTPQLLLDHCLTAGITHSNRPLSIIDAGCGTGLCAPLFREYAITLTGVDLSEGMLNQAQQRHLYDDLHKAELTCYLQQFTKQHDLIISADTLVYFGDLKDVAAASCGALKAGGWLVFSVEKLPPSDTSASYQLNLSGRYSHTEHYLQQVLTSNGFERPAIEAAVLRQELGKPVNGFVVLAQKL